MGVQDPLKWYRQTAVDKDRIEENLSGYRIVQLLLNNALEKLAWSKGFMAASGWESIRLKGETLSNVITILETLQAALDLEKGGELAQNLNYLYGYMQQKLLEANLENKVALIDEVMALLSEIKMGWDGIAHSSSDSNQGPL